MPHDKRDVQDILTFLQDASAEVKVAAREGKCWDTAEKEMSSGAAAGSGAAAPNSLI